MIELRSQLMNGARQAGDLVKSLGVSRAALKKAYEREADKVLRFGRARRTQYAARRILTGLNTDEFMETRMKGGLPRANAVKYVVDKHDVNMLSRVCAIDRATLTSLMMYCCNCSIAIGLGF